MDGKPGITQKEIAFAKSIAGKLYNKYKNAPGINRYTPEDFHHEAVAGLVQASRNYNGDVPFLAFASYRIRGAVMDMLRKNDMIRLSQEDRGKYRRLKNAAAELEGEGNSYDAETLAEKLGWTLDEVHHVKTLRVYFDSMDAEKTSRDGESGNLGEVLPAHQDDQEKLMIRNQIRTIVEGCIKKALKTRERAIFNAILVMNQTLAEAARDFGCTHQNIWNILKKAKEKMKTCLKKKDVTGYDVNVMFE